MYVQSINPTNKLLPCLFGISHAASKQAPNQPTNQAIKSLFLSFKVMPMPMLMLLPAFPSLSLYSTPTPCVSHAAQHSMHGRKKESLPPSIHPFIRPSVRPSVSRSVGMCIRVFSLGFSLFLRYVHTYIHTYLRRYMYMSVYGVFHR